PRPHAAGAADDQERLAALPPQIEADAGPTLARAAQDGLEDRLHDTFRNTAELGLLAGPREDSIFDVAHHDRSRGLGLDLAHLRGQLHAPAPPLQGGGG